MSDCKCTGNETTWDNNYCSGNLWTNIAFYPKNKWNIDNTSQDQRQCFFETVKKNYTPKDLCKIIDGCCDTSPDDDKMSTYKTDMLKILDKCSNNYDSNNDNNISKTTIIMIVIFFILVIGGYIFKYLKNNNLIKF
jgi:hypothetical protein